MERVNHVKEIWLLLKMKNVISLDKPRVLTWGFKKVQRKVKMMDHCYN